MQISQDSKHDVLIIGSGASGGMAANILAQKGIKCLMLDAGPKMDLDGTANSGLCTICRTAGSASRAVSPM